MPHRIVIALMSLFILCAPDSSTPAVRAAQAELPTTTTVPDDFYTLYPEWSDDNLDYLDPGAHTSGTAPLPGTGGPQRALALVSCAAVVIGVALSRGAGTHARRR